jgi:hypothetical protein
MLMANWRTAQWMLASATTTTTAPDETHPAEAQRPESATSIPASLQNYDIPAYPSWSRQKIR